MPANRPAIVRRAVVASVVLVLAATACFPAWSQAAEGFSGLWETSFGRMRVIERDGRLEGAYSYSSGSTLEGTVADRKATLSYREPETTGEAEFELAADGQSFHGRWRAAGDEEWSDWVGHRVAATPGRKYLVVLEARWEANLAEQEYLFGDMLRAFFARVPDVQVRTREFHDEVDFRRWCGELAYLAEPVVLVIASHAGPEGVTVGGQTIGAEAIAESLRYSAGIELVHFSACGIMAGDLAPKVQESLRTAARFPISGYASTVDWATSAVVEFMYLDLVLWRGVAPLAAAEQLKAMIPLAGEESLAGVDLSPARFRILPVPPLADAPEAVAEADPPAESAPPAETEPSVDDGAAAEPADDFLPEASKPTAP